MEREEILKNVPIFSRLDRGHLKRLSKLMVERRFGAGDVIMKEGGQAAGTAAAMALQAGVGVKELDVARLQQRLRQQGAVLE